MRRPLLLAAAVLVPLAVAAGINTAPPGKVVNLANYNGAAAASYVNATHCADTPAAPSLEVEWSITYLPGGGLVGTGTYQLYASNLASSEGDDPNFCPEAPAETAANPEYAQSVGFATRTNDIQSLAISGSEAVAAARKSCARDGDVIYVCAHLLDANSDKKGFARGKFIVQVTAPAAPGGVRAGEAGEGRMAVGWDANSSGVKVDYYVAVATAADGTEFRSGNVSGTSATLKGLTDGTQYTVVVYAYSLGGNESPPSGSVTATSGPVKDFWEAYQEAGGTDDGGCASGGAGPLALLGLASLLLLRRRR